MAGGAVTTIAQGDHPGRIAIDGGYVYWTDQSDNFVGKTTVDGSTTVTLAVAQDKPALLHVDATSVYWVNDGAAVVRLTPK